MSTAVEADSDPVIGSQCRVSSTTALWPPASKEKGAEEEIDDALEDVASPLGSMADHRTMPLEWIIL